MQSSSEDAGDGRGWRAGFEAEIDELFRRRLRVACAVFLLLHVSAFAIFSEASSSSTGATVRIALIQLTAAHLDGI